MSLVPYDDRDGFIWMNGTMVPWRDAKVHVLTHALHYASCVFEGERVYDGRIFKLTEHTLRLANSATKLGFELPYDIAAIEQACKQVVAANGIGDGYVRPLAWRGPEMMGVSAQNCRINVAVAAWTWPAYFTPEARLKGIRMTRAIYDRPAPTPAPRTRRRAEFMASPRRPTSSPFRSSRDSTTTPTAAAPERRPVCGRTPAPR